MTGVNFEVAGAIFLMPEAEATIRAENLRLLHASGRDDYGVEGALALADAIEDALTGALEVPIPLEGEAAESMYYEINGSTTYPQGEALGLWRAVRALHARRLDSLRG